MEYRTYVKAFTGTILNRFTNWDLPNKIFKEIYKSLNL